MIDPGEDTRGFSNAMVKSLTCGTDERSTRRRGEHRGDYKSRCTESRMNCTVFWSNGEELLGPDVGLGQPCGQMELSVSRTRSSSFWRPAGDSAAYYERRGVRTMGSRLGRDCVPWAFCQWMICSAERAANRRREVGFWMRQVSYHGVDGPT
jgi:hypothetical protein